MEIEFYFIFLMGKLTRSYVYFNAYIGNQGPPCNVDSSPLWYRIILTKNTRHYLKLSIYKHIEVIL